MGQFPGYGRLPGWQLAVGNGVLRLVVGTLDQVEDGLQLLGFELVTQFLPGQVEPRDQAIDLGFHPVQFMFQTACQ